MWRPVLDSHRLVSGNAPQIAAGYTQWLSSGGGSPNATVYVRQAS